MVQVEGDTWGDKYKIASEARGSCWQLYKQEIGTDKGKVFVARCDNQSEQAYDVIKEKEGEDGLKHAGVYTGEEVIFLLPSMIINL